ncbi:MAG: transcriptional repressor [Planctomycetes bacterium]|nr:transcriptional repressor [Planctomycetota bacterium]
MLECALKREDHFRADDIAAVLARGTDRVSRGTVYRTLALMVETGMLRQTRDSDTHVHYERVWGHPHHEHMICDCCGAFIEFSDDKITKYLEHECKSINFKERTHRIVIFGVCEDCQKHKSAK